MLTDAFSPDAERAMFSLLDDLVGGHDTWADHKRLGHPLNMYDMPPFFFQLANVVRDSGLSPGIVQPDYALHLNYAGARAAFNAHFDSRYRWGESVIGITLGVACRSGR